MRLVVVKWIDAECQESRWNDLEETLEELNEEIQPCVTAGFLLKDTPQFLAITLTDHMILLLNLFQRCEDTTNINKYISGINHVLLVLVCLWIT